MFSENKEIDDIIMRKKLFELTLDFIEPFFVYFKIQANDLKKFIKHEFL